MISIYNKRLLKKNYEYKLNLFFSMIKNIFSKKVFITFIFFISAPFLNLAQENKNKEDSLRLIKLEEIVVTANRFENELFNSGAPVYIIEKSELEKFPVNSFSELLRYLPGLSVSSTDGMGMNPIINVRGFYGGGEAEYLTLLIDGVPVNNLENGLVNWNMLPISQISRVEYMTGGSSTLYGDAAMGGVINLITKEINSPYTNTNLSFGSYDTYRFELNNGNVFKKGYYNLYTDYYHTIGFRDNSQINSFSIGGKAEFNLNQNSKLTFQSLNRISKAQDPGPLSSEFIIANNRKSENFFKSDRRNINSFFIKTNLLSNLNEYKRINISLAYHRKNNEVIRTFTQPSLILKLPEIQPVGVYDTTMFGNSKKRELFTNQLHLALNLINNQRSGIFKLIGGIDFDYGDFKNTEEDIFKGFEIDYQKNYQTYDSIDFIGNGFRFRPASYLNLETTLSGKFRLITGLRYDMIYDVFNSDFPLLGKSSKKFYHAISPRIALTYLISDRRNYSGSLFFNISRSFKTPTIDQRSDLKTLNYAMFIQAGSGYQMMLIKADPFSNPDLKPQKSWNMELGTYKNFIVEDMLNARVNLTLYLTHVEDEIDFDLQGFRYRNIRNSRHSGIESSILLLYNEKLRYFLNYNYSFAKFVSGINKGMNIKGVPRVSYNTGFSYIGKSGIQAGIYASGVRGVYLDDENTSKIPPYNNLNLRLGYSLKSLTLHLDIENIANNNYTTSGYLIYGNTLLYPSAGRRFKLSLGIDF